MYYFGMFVIWLLILFGAISVVSLGLLLFLRLQKVRLEVADEASKCGW